MPVNLRAVSFYFQLQSSLSSSKLWLLRYLNEEPNKWPHPSLFESHGQIDYLIIQCEPNRTLKLFKLSINFILLLMKIAINCWRKKTLTSTCLLKKSVNFYFPRRISKALLLATRNVKKTRVILIELVCL